MRVFELAKELGVESRILLERCSRVGIFPRSASSTLSEDDAATLRAWVKVRPINPFPATQRVAEPSTIWPRPLASVSRGQRYKGEIAPLTQLMLERRVLPRRSFMVNGRPFVDEVVLAQRFALEWGDVWFDHKQARRWLDSHPHIKPATAAALAGVEMTPEEAAERIWFGKRHPHRPTLADRVGCGDLTAKQARDELRALLP